MKYTHKDLVNMVTGCKVCMRMIRKYQSSQLGKIKSKKKAKSSRENGKLGGRPRK